MKFRRNVAFILTRPLGEILVCERSDFKDSWQFPQGGARNDESDLEALHREVLEEISLPPETYRVVLQHGPYRYVFRSGSRKEGCDGQEQIYFQAEWLGTGEIAVDKKEFRRFRWIKPETFLLDWVPPIKRDVYRRVFRDFFQIELK
ncbi:MAG: NUDIX domain-containing protein [Chthoniobacterales bacterium]|nr:NUDIX domain-containing protein [Chthoniobacterales bacterium]